jgi:hypothetical protein
MPKMDKVLTFGMLSESVEKQVKPFVANKVHGLCGGYMLSVRAVKTLVSDVP